MNVALRYIILLPAFLLSLSGSSQSMMQDIRLLQQSAEAVKEPGASNVTRVEHAARILAILDHYRQWGTSLMGEIPSIQAAKILDAYRHNPAIVALLEGIEQKLDSFPTEYTETFQQTRQQLRSGERERIMEIYNSEFALSPSEYLSVSRTLMAYTHPPLPSIAALSSAAQSSNKNVKKGVVSEAAIIIGLFEFLLDRGKEEVVITFLDRLLGKNGIADLRALFPKTVDAYADRDFSYSESFIERLRDAFYEDLQLLSVTLPELLGNEEYYDLWKNDALAFGFLQLYTMVGLAQQDVPISEIIPLTYRSLFERYKDEEKAFNLKMVDSIGTLPAYGQLVSTTDQIVQQMLLVNRQLDQRTNELTNRVEILEEEYEDETGPIMSEEQLTLRTLLRGENNGGYSLEMLPGLLTGKLDASTIRGRSSLEFYDQYLRNPLSKKQLQAAGLELARQLNGKWYQSHTIMEMVRGWREQLLEFEVEINKYEAELDSAKIFRKDSIAFETAKNALSSTLTQLAAIQPAGQAQSEASTLQLSVEVLHGVITDTPPPISDKVEKLRFQWEELRATEDRLRELNTRYRSSFKLRNQDPITRYFNSRVSRDSFAELNEQIHQLDVLLQKLDNQLLELDTTVLLEKHHALENLAPLVQLTGVLSNLMYTFHSGQKGPEHRWVNIRQVDTLLFSDTQRPLFLELLQQQLGQTKVAGSFSLSGLTMLIRSTVGDLQLLSRDTSAVVPDSMTFFRKAMFASNAINRLLELPIMINPKDRTKPVSLVNLHPELKPIPKLTDQALDFIYYINIKDHQHAVSSLIRLLTDLVPVVAEAVPPRPPVSSQNTMQRPTEQANGDQNKNAIAQKDKHVKRETKKLLKRIPDKGAQTVSFLQKYGYFIADLIDADSGKQVQRLLEQVSDPPGSSRIKRREPFTASINGYLGALVGRERLRGDALRTDDGESFATFAPTIPVGLTFSKLLGKGPKAQSFSLFLSVLDLGSLTTFQLGDGNIEGENELSFKNVLKPGLQLHWNIKKSPFYMGVGGQYGPQFREFDGEQKQLNSFRYFFTMGVDVVIKRLY